MDRGAWVYIMADRYRGTMYVGVTAHLAARVDQYRRGDGSDFCQRYGFLRLVCADRAEDMLAATAYEKRLKRWRRDWKFELVERANPEWLDLFDTII